MSDKPLLVVIYPYKFQDFLWNLIELDQFIPFVDVNVIDLSSVTTPKFSRSISSARSERREITFCLSIREFRKLLSSIRQAAEKRDVTILNEINWSSSRQFFCNLLLCWYLKGAKVKVVDLYNGGVTLAGSRKESATAAPDGLLKRFQNLFRQTKTFSEFSHHLTAAILSRLAKAVPGVLTHRLVAGREWEELAKRYNTEGLKLVYGHSHDFSNYLLRSLKAPVVVSEKRMAVLLDSAGPAFASDAVYTGFKISRTSEIWYPALVRFFETLESQANLEVEIAGHYKSKHSPRSPYFGGRLVNYGRTYELVRDSCCVITINSTAVSYAVIFRKPVIFIYSNQLLQEEATIEYIDVLSSLLGATAVNIDDIPNDLGELLKCDEEKYKAYEQNILSSSPSRRPNVQIILEEIMGIDTKDFFEPSVTARCS